MNQDTCKTFATEQEAAAFMLGFNVGSKAGIYASIDQQEPNTVLIDFEDEDAMMAWLELGQSPDDSD